MKRYLLHIAGLLLLLPLFHGCSTEKNTFASRAYHSITSQYNIFFNANESFEAGVAKVDESIEDDFTRLLPLYKESDPSVANLVKSDMEEAIVKASKIIEIHSITAKPERRRRGAKRNQEFALKDEYNPWVDDSYLLMGKAWFYQHNFLTAVDNFSYILRNYPYGDALHEAQVWLIRSYTELERFAEASEAIQAVQADQEFPRKLEGELAIAIADNYIRQQNFAEAIRFIDIALNKTRGKKDKARLQYIEAQLYEELDQPMKAAGAYKNVARFNPEYKMAFNSKIKAASVFSGEGDTEKDKKTLRRMLRDRKNTEFRDQIYYALGNINLAEGNREAATDHYRNSVASSFNNQFQRALSAITLADIYFELQNYRGAQAYYDSAMIIIDDEYPGYDDLSEKYRNLTNLVENIMIVEREDSLQKIAQMPDEEREALIAHLMAEEQERLQNAENLMLQDQGNQGLTRFGGQRMGMGTPAGGGGGWYFYNPQTVAYGKVSFEQQWGQRPLEDNWRRSNKNTVSVADMDDPEEAADSVQSEERVRDPLKEEFYTQDLPLTDSLMLESHIRIRDALYNTGKIYKSEFSNYARSAEAFEELMERYPDNTYQLPAWYDLYDLHELMDDSQQAEFYKNLIVANYPESNYSQYLVNPDYFMELELRKDSLNQLYEEIFRNYRSGNYKNVITLAGTVKEMQPDSILLSKVDFMEAVAMGTQSDIHSFESLLQDYTGKWPEAEPAPLAIEILTLIQDSTLADYQKLVDMGYINEEIENEELMVADSALNDEFGGKYSYDEDLLHYFVVAYPVDAAVDLNRLKFDIANYNIDHYTKTDFDIESEPLNEKFNLVTVRALGNKDEGLIYHRSIIRKEPVFQSLSDTDYFNFTISSANYRQIVSENSINDYLKFFVKNYSRFIKSDFSSDEPDISPEELMARARAEEQVLREKGEYRVVETGRTEQLFSPDIDGQQNFVLAVKDPRVSMQRVLAGFTRLNNEEFNGWNLTAEISRTGDYQLLVISGIPTLNEASSYFGKVVLTRSLFEPLGQATYRNFLITSENLEQLIEEEGVEDYIGFFRSYYIRKGQAGTATAPVAEDTNRPRADVQPEVQVQTEEQPESYSGPYSTEIESEHLFVFVIPSSGVDKTQFIEGLEEYNRSASDANLAIREVPVDEFRTAVAIEGLPDLESAQRFSGNLVQNRALYEPLGEETYRNFLISQENFDVFLQEKNITEYMEFYKQVYLNQ